jgi:hypothetical protein
MACPLLDQLFAWANQQPGNPSIEVDLTTYTDQELPHRQFERGHGEGRLQYHQGKWIKIGEFGPWYSAPAFFTGTVSYGTGSGAQTEDVTVQIAAPSAFMLNATYSVTFLPKEGLLTGSFTPTCQPVNPAEIGGVITGFASGVSVMMSLSQAEG